MSYIYYISLGICKWWHLLTCLYLVLSLGMFLAGYRHSQATYERKKYLSSGEKSCKIRISSKANHVKISMLNWRESTVFSPEIDALIFELKIEVIKNILVFLSSSVDERKK